MRRESGYGRDRCTAASLTDRRADTLFPRGLHGTEPKRALSFPRMSGQGAGNLRKESRHVQKSEKDLRR